MFSATIFANELADDPGALFEERTVRLVKGRGNVTVNVNLTNDFASGSDWNDNLGLRFERAREITGISGDVVHDHSFPAAHGRATDSLADWDLHVLGRGTAEWTQQQNTGVFRI